MAFLYISKHHTGFIYEEVFIQHELEQKIHRNKLNKCT